MANTIITKGSNTTTNIPSLTQGADSGSDAGSELAINRTDHKIFYLDSSDNVVSGFEPQIRDALALQSNGGLAPSTVGEDLSDVICPLVFTLSNPTSAQSGYTTFTDARYSSRPLFTTGKEGAESSHVLPVLWCNPETGALNMFKAITMGSYFQTRGVGDGQFFFQAGYPAAHDSDKWFIGVDNVADEALGHMTWNSMATGSYVKIMDLDDEGNLDAASYKIGGTSVLTSNTLGSGVVTSSLTTVGTIGSGTWEGTTVAVLQGGTGVTSKTGTGNVVLSSSPTLATPALGTPASGVMTNMTGAVTASIVDDAITLAKMAQGADGSLITYDGSTNPALVPPGASGQVLTSRGDASTPTFQAAGVASSVMANDIIAGDDAVSVATSSGNVVIDSNAGATTIDGHTGVTIQSNSGTFELNSNGGTINLKDGTERIADFDRTLYTIQSSGTLKLWNEANNKYSGIAAAEGMAADSILYLPTGPTSTGAMLTILAISNNPSTSYKTQWSSSSARSPTSHLSGAITDVSSHGLAASATTDTTNASNISSGTLAVDRAPPMVAAVDATNSAGIAGISPAPPAGSQYKVLSGGNTFVTNKDTTYTPLAVTGASAVLRLSAAGTGSGNQDITFADSGGMTITATNPSTITFSSANDNTVDMGSGFVIEDGDGTEVTITENKEVKFIDGAGIDINWTDTSTGSDGDPYDLTFIVDHDAATNFVANEHLDWTASVGTIHSGNYTNTTYSVGDGGLTQNNFTNTLKSKLDAVEASADVTDTTNVTAAGALMDSELAGIAAVKATTGTFLSADESKLDGIAASANNYSLPSASLTVVGGVELATTSETTTGTDATRAATPAGVQAAIDALVDSAPGALDTLNELAAAIGDDASYASTITTALALKSTIASPTFTGIVTTPDLTITDLPSHGSEATALVVASNVVGYRELGTNAFNSTTIATNNNQLTNGAGYITSYTNTQLSTEQVQDIVGAMFTSNTETRIAATYEDGDGTIDLVVTDMTANDNTWRTVTAGGNTLSTSETLAFTAGTGITISESAGAVTITNSVTDTNTWRGVTAGGNTLASNETLAFTAGTNVTITESGGAVTITSADTNTQLSTEAVQDIVGAMFTSNTETRIAATYEDGDGTIDLVVTDMTANDNTWRTVTAGGNTLSTSETLAFTAGTGITIAESAGAVTITNSIADTTLSTEQVQDIVGAMFTSNTETRVAATYQDGDGTIDLVVDDMTANDNTQLSTEQVQDIVGAMFTSNTETRIAATYEDGDGTIDLVVTDMTANDNTWRGVTAGGNTLASNETLAFTAGTNVTITESGGAVTITAADTDTNTTYTAGDFITLTGTDFDVDVLDEDDLATDSATKLATQQSIKAYVDAGLAASGSGDVTGVTLASDSGSASDTTGNVDLTITGGTNVTTSATGTTLTINATDTNTQLSTEAVQDIVGAMFTSNTETRVAATYQDGDGTIDLVVTDMTANDNTWRTVTAGGNTLSTSETLAFTAGTNVTITESAGAVTITSADTNTTYSSSDFTHDDLTGFVANEHLDWTSDQGGTNIHSGNYTDTNTTYSVGDGGLTTNDFTNADHSKLNAIAASANNYTLPSASLTVVGGVELATTSETTTGTDATRAATPAGVQAAIDALVDSAPGALDTLNELAAAIGDDASYASTITTALALKSTIASPTFTGVVTTPDLTITDLPSHGSEATALVVASNVVGYRELGTNAFNSTTIPTNNNQLTNGSGYITATLTTEAVQDIVGAMFTSNTETRIAATYEDGDGTIDLVVTDMTANDNTWRTVTAGGNTLSTSETLAFTAGTNVTITESAGAVTITSADTNTQLSTEAVQDIVGAMFTSNTETRATVTYQDGDGTIDVVVDDMTGGGGEDNEYSFKTINCPSGTDPVADTTTDTLNFTASGGMTITGTVGTDTVNFSSTDTNTTYSVGDGGLTTNDFTNADHSKLNAIAASATNVTNNNQITNGAGYITSYTNTVDMGSGFVMEDGDGTEVTITEDKEVKFVEGTGIDINWTDTSTGSDGDPFDLTFTNTGVTSIVAGSNISISGATGAVTVTATDTNTTYSVGDGGLTQNNFTNADHSKLNAIEASADVTDATNVTAAGALMDSECSSLASVKALTGTNTGDQTVAYTSAISTGNSGLVPSAGTSGHFLKHDGTFGLPSYTTNTNTQLSTEQVQDIVGAMLVGTETRIGVSYDDTNGEIDFVVDDMTANDNTTYSAGTGIDIIGGGNAITIEGASINEGMLDVSNSPSDNQILSYNSAGSNFTWVDDATGGGGGNADTITVIDGSDTTSYLCIFDSATGALPAKTDGALRYNASTGALTATSLVGTADSALIFKNARTIAGVSFDGSANISLNNNAISNGAGYITSYTNTVDMGSGFIMEDGDGTEVTITEDKEVKFVEGTGIDINWTDTSTGSDGDPYDLTFTNTGVTSNVAGNAITISGATGAVTINHADTSSQASVDNSGTTAIQDITLDTYGHVTSITSANVGGGGGGVNVGTGAANDRIAIWENSGDIGGQSNATIDSSGNAAFGGTVSDGNAQLCYTAQSTQTMALTHGGLLTMTSGVASLDFFSPPSDERLKTGITTLEYGLNEIKAISPKWYKLSESSFTSSGLTNSIATGEHKDAYFDLQRYGLMAADVKTVMPKLVSKIEDDKDYETYDKDALIFVLINAVKELEARVATLEA